MVLDYKLETSSPLPESSIWHPFSLSMRVLMTCSREMINSEEKSD
jgi:hypothetical protein